MVVDNGHEPFLVPSLSDEAEVELDGGFPFSSREQATQVASVIRAQEVPTPLSHVVGDSMNEVVARTGRDGEADSVAGVHDGDEQTSVGFNWQ